ncbi:HlyD family secretion protein [Alkanindiges illinoisensis]|uniref:HlyD family secretion protein n=1 Tax=Alkanindiges illinoisensis TaxID=197183 RepID=A0A4Y7XCN3_9GAMM|nr:HlyD family secretion protein [Alkanindiges illinoisensis]TEU27367.1 HlyD family secretion protein [Alkanindiges illinoisensis]
MNDNNQSPEQNNQILENRPDSSIDAADVIPDNLSTKKSRIIRSLIIVFLIAMVGLGLWLANKPAPQQIQGMVEANTLNVSTKVPSRVEQLMAEEGASVKKGQILGILTSPELQAKQQQAEGALQSARALEQTAERGSQQENIASLKANWQSALAQAELARVTYQRAQNLFNEGVISRQRRDEAQAAKNSSAQIAEAAHQQYLRAERGSTPEQLSSAQAQVKIAEAAVAEAKSLNQEMQLIAPEDGEVSQKFANVGELVPAGIPLYTLIDLRNQWVSINLREDQFNQLRHGSILHGNVPALNQKNVAFQVTHIAAQGTFASWKATRQSSGYDIRTFEIKLKSLQPLAGLRPGMSVLFDWPQTQTEPQTQSQTASTH